MKLNKHRKVQLMVTTGVVVTTFISLFHSEYGTIIVAVSTLTNFIWVWAE
jgi:hypothetical protein